MPSMVSDASAMFVATTTLRVPSGVGAKMRCCCSYVCAPNTGQSSMGGMESSPHCRCRSSSI